jgi:hypothetical protein
LQILDAQAIPIALQIIAYAYLTIGLGGSLYIILDIKRGHRQMIPFMNVVWPITVFYLGPLGLWAYWHLGHSSLKKTVINGNPQLEPMQEDIQNVHRVKPHKTESRKPFWESIFVSATHCGGGCTLGDVVSAWLIFLTSITLFGSTLAAAYVFDFTFAWILGIIFQYLAITEMKKISVKKGLIEAIKADTISLVAFEIGLFGWMALVTFVIFDRTWHANPTEPVYWFMMQIGMTIGFFTSYPVNWCLVKKGIKHGM